MPDIARYCQILPDIKYNSHFCYTRLDMPDDVKPFLFQDQLQKEAKSVLGELDLLPLLSKYGSPKIIGSMDLGLMTRRDIDIEIIVNDFGKKELNQIVQTILEKPLPRIDFTLMDNSDKNSLEIPRGLFLWIKYSGNNKLISKYTNISIAWTIDCWFLKEEYADAGKVTKEIKEKLTPETKRIILEIKSSLMNNTEYKEKFSGIDIYRAVLDKDIKTKKDFLKSLTS